MTTYKVDSYHIGKMPKQKSNAIWADCSSQAVSFPLVYLKKPKHIGEGHWALILNSIKLEMPVDTIIEYGE